MFNFFFQRNCIEFALKAKPVRRYIPKNPLQYRLWAFATSPFCEYTVFIAILLNTTSLAMKFYKQPTAYTDFLDVLNQVFTYFFLVECILKLGAFRFKVSLTGGSLKRQACAKIISFRTISVILGMPLTSSLLLDPLWTSAWPKSM